MIRLGYIFCFALLYGLIPRAAFCASLTPIQHVIIIMQENRSFDDYFGTFPGANGIPSGTCVPMNPSNPSAGCVAPFHDPRDVQSGGPHRAADAQADIDDGITQAKMDGFVHQELLGKCTGSTTCPSAMQTMLAGTTLPLGYDVMGYHTADEIPNYWSYANAFVLQDNLFESVRGWSLMAHLYLTSEWSAACKKGVLSTCTTSPDLPFPAPGTVYPWVNLFQLMDLQKVSWKYYLGQGNEPDCDDDEMTCAPAPQSSTVPSHWNPAPFFAWVQAQGAAYLALHNPPADQFLLDVKNGAICRKCRGSFPSQQYSEHPLSGTTAGMDYVTAMVNAVMQSPYWQNTAIFVTWDDWGGFYDHVPPPIVDRNSTANPIQGYGLRVPGLVISAYAKKHYIDHQFLSFDSYATFIEHIFMNDTRLNPVIMKQPDARPTVRDAIKTVTLINGSSARIGQLANDFDFTSPPRAPLILNTHIPAQLKLQCDKLVANTVNCAKGFGTLTISWRQFTGTDTSNVFTYHVLRDGIALPQCTVSASTCTDTPPAGYHYYRAYSVDKFGVTSPTSPSAFVRVVGN